MRSTRVAWAALVAAIALTGGAITLGTSIGEAAAPRVADDPPVLAVSPPPTPPLNPVPSTTVPPTTAPPPTASTAAEATVPTTRPANLVDLPVPADLPLDPYEATPHQVVSIMHIPALGVSEPVGEGMTLTALNRGPSHWPGTAMPGQLGNVVVGGHRTTFSKPFRHLDKLAPDDEVIFETAEGTFTYQVVGTEIVGPEELSIADQAVEHTATLFACHPPGSAAYRIVANLRLVDDDGVPVAAPPLQVGNAAEITRFRS